MVSWWLRKNNLPWPDENGKEIFRRRADAMAREGVNSAIIFGAHFRWDFEPVWDQLHELIHFVAGELHQRDILLFDHHSSVLSCNYNPDPNRFNARRTSSNHRQVLISPPAGIMPGPPRDEWKMIHLVTGNPIFLPQYAAQEFCMNNPDFSAAYRDYVRKLLRETAIDGLMSDDAVFYSHAACGCVHCRARYRREYGIDLPETSDLSFWGNWENPSYRNYLDMRRHIVRDYFAEVKSVLPESFPLMSCCSSSIHPYSSERALSYHLFLEAGANTIMLEMCGNTPNAKGKLFGELSSQMHHLALSRENHLPCIGLGYGFSSDAAKMIWAFNKFLGSDTWYSSLVHRLGLSDSDITAIPDDPEHLDGIFNYEKKHPQWFDSESAAECALFFSRSSLDHYGSSPMDYSADYSALCDAMVRHGFDADTVTRIPSSDSNYKVLLLPSAVCVSDSELEKIEGWVQSGKKAIAFGPFAFFDENRNPRKPDFFARHHLDIQLPPLNRSGHSPDQRIPLPPPAVSCTGIKQVRIGDHFHWFAERPAEGLAPDALDVIRQEVSPSVSNGWFIKKYKGKNGELLVHCIVLEYAVALNQKLEALRDPESPCFDSLKIISEIRPARTTGKLRFRSPQGFLRVERMLPLSGMEAEPLPLEEIMEPEPPEHASYLILRFSK